MSDENRTYTELQQLIHDALRRQHPEWVEPNGSSPICDSYDARLAELLRLFTPQDDVSFVTVIEKEVTEMGRVHRPHRRSRLCGDPELQPRPRSKPAHHDS